MEAPQVQQEQPPRIKFRYPNPLVDRWKMRAKCTVQYLENLQESFAKLVGGGSLAISGWMNVIIYSDLQHSSTWLEAESTG
jgi:hypothetical protein